MSQYLQEAFKQFKLLEGEEFDIDDSGIEDMKSFIDNDEATDFTDIIDPEAETEEDLEDSYIGKIILDCHVCHSKIYKNAEDVDYNEETGIANEGEECPFCYSVDGFEIVGQVAPYQETEVNVDVEPKEDEVEDSIEISTTGKKGFEAAGAAMDAFKDESLKEAVDFKTMPIPKVGATFAFRANVDQDRVLDLIQKNNLKYDEYNDHGALIWLIGHTDTDHIATYVPETQTLYTSSREAFRECFGESLKEGYSVVDLETGDRFGNFSDLESAKAKAFQYAKTCRATAAVINDDLKPVCGYNSAGKEIRIKEELVKESLGEGLENLDIETEHDKIHVSAEEKEPTGEEVIAPVEPAQETTILNDKTPAEESEEEVEFDFDDFDEEPFDTMGESYLKKVYENVNSFKTSKVKVNGNQLVVEGIIKFKSGKDKKTSFKFEAKDCDRKGNVRFIGENLQISRGKKSFSLRGSINENKLTPNQLKYNYTVNGNRVSGKVLAEAKKSKSLKEAELSKVAGTASNAMSQKDVMDKLGKCTTAQEVKALANSVIPENRKKEANVKKLMLNLDRAKDVVRAQTAFTNFILKGDGLGSIDKQVAGKKEDK